MPALMLAHVTERYYDFSEELLKYYHVDQYGQGRTWQEITSIRMRKVANAYLSKLLFDSFPGEINSIEN